MKSSEPSAETVTLSVYSPDPIVEIFVIDGRFNLVARGVGMLKEKLPPGLYKVKFKVGSVIKEVDAILEPGKRSVEIFAPQMLISTSAPLEQTRTGRASHLQKAAELSHQSHTDLEGESGLFVFARDLEPESQTDPARGLSLRAMNGKLLVDFAQEGARDLYEHWAGCSVSLPPGAYRLRLQTRSAQVLEQTVILNEGWQTQVFLLNRPYGRSRLRARYADLANASILMARRERGFDPASEDMRWTEMARLGLVDGHTIVPSQELHDMLWDKYQNPMLGIFAAHLMLISRKPPVDMLAMAVHNLYNLLGPHPDVLALRLRLAEHMEVEPEGIPPYEAPPMLRNSWDIVIKASAGWPLLVPYDSLAARVSGRLWGSGAWMVWLNPPSANKLHKRTGGTAPELSESLPELNEIIEETDDLEALAEESDLDEMETSLLRYMTSVSQPARFRSLDEDDDERQRSRKQARYTEQISDESLVAALRMPNSRARDVAASLLDKLKRHGGS